ncbi:MAG: hypothetical protein ACFFEN_01465 [Candidatus Thorarchaeota archaeon]
MNLNSIYSEIKQSLSLTDEDFDLEKNINYYFREEPDTDKLEIVGDILNFINKFSMFQDIKPFMNSLYTCILNTLGIKPESVFDFEELLVKNAIMHFVQEYINYSKIDQKEQVLKFLATSLEKLETEPLIMNLGLLIKPIYQDQEYLKDLSGIKEFEVDYNSINATDIQIKSDIDEWLKAQEITLDKQEELRKNLLVELDRLILKYNLPKNSEISKKLHIEAREMLTMKLTMLSLMEHLPEDSIEPIPIK